MSSRLLAPGLALGALLADAGGVHDFASWLVLLAVPAAAATAFVGVSDALAGMGALRGVTASPAMLLLVLGSAVREGAPRGAAVPVLAVSSTALALACYGIPALVWLLEPLRPVRTARPTPRASRA
jgi:hypothetical protein